MGEMLATRQAEQYQLEAKLGDKEKQLVALATKVSRSDDLIDMFELNFKQVQQEVEELSAAFRMERDTGIVSLRSAPIALTRSLSD
jgi:peptidoglycan hydrolase CwlO-like protein